MAVHLSEEEQIEALKRWWKDNGKATIAALLVAGAGFFGWNQYQEHQEQRAVEGSIRYQAFLEAQDALTTAEDRQAAEQRVEALAEELISDFSGTLYADFARLHRAQQAIQEDDLEHARRILETLSDAADEASTRGLVQLRLGRVLAAQGETESALSLLANSPTTAFAPLYAENRGDILLRQDRYDEARTAYESALEALQQSPIPMRSNLVQYKIDSTRVAGEAGNEAGEGDTKPAAPDENAADGDNAAGEA